MSEVRLRAQRDAIRREIHVISSAVEDIPLCIERGQTDRPLVVATIGWLQRWVAALDSIGWQEAPDAPDLQDGSVDPDLAMWARCQTNERRDHHR